MRNNAPTRRDPTTIPVDSALIQSVAYAEDATLTVRFHSGAEYCFYTVPRRVFEAFLAAPSKGAYFNRHIREAFPFRRVIDPTSDPDPAR